jgi:uncharacterized RDD family membrane protein YckC
MNTNYAGFWLRFVAYVIDAIILGCVQGILIMPILAIFGIGIASKAGDFDSTNFDAGNDAAVMGFAATILAFIVLYQIVFFVLQTLYHAFMESSKFQGSVGKLALSLKVTDMNGDKLEFGKALVRNLGKVVSHYTALIGYIIAAFTDKKQALHDLIASTLVVKK